MAACKTQILHRIIQGPY